MYETKEEENTEEDPKKIYVKRRYDWKDREERYQIQPAGFIPPNSDQESYVTLDEFSKELIGEMETLNHKNSDIVFKGSGWEFEGNSETDSTLIFDKDDNLLHTLKGNNWYLSAKDGYYFMKAINENE